jgi:hypothetical protein
VFRDAFIEEMSMMECVGTITPEGYECLVTKRVTGARVFVRPGYCVKCPRVDDNTGHVSAVITSVLRGLASGRACSQCSGAVLSRADATALAAKRPPPPAVPRLLDDGTADLRECAPCKDTMLEKMKSAIDAARPDVQARIVTP